MLTELAAHVRLTPTVVRQVADGRVQLELPDAYVWARSALAFPYEFVTGDEVLAVGQDDDWYVIGVLKGTGPTALTVPGDLKISAPRGRIEMTAAKGVRIKSPAVRIVAESMELAATAIFERFTEATRWVRDTFQLRAGRQRTRIEGTSDLKAGSILQKAENDVTIDGKKIHLG